MRWILLPACCLMIAILSGTGCVTPAGIPGQGGTLQPTSEPTNEPTLLPTQVSIAPAATFIPYETIPAVPVTPVYTRTTPVTPFQQPGYRAYGSPVPGQAGPEVTDPARISFRHYADQNFAVDYPANWTVTGTGNVQFRSASGQIVFTAQVSDLLPGLVGNVRLNPDIAAIKDIVSREFPGYSADAIVADYQNLEINGVPATAYSVRAGPVAYRRYIIVSLHHVYWITFSTDPALFDTSASLRQYMFGTLAIYDPA